MYYYDTVSEAISGLRERGYTKDFTIYPEKECLVCHEKAINLSPEEFFINEIYRFEGYSDPGDEMIVYAISSTIHRVKGIVVNAFGIYANEQISKIVKHLHGI